MTTNGILADAVMAILAGPYWLKPLQLVPRKRPFRRF
jgi:hypothetical protein